VDKRDFVMLYLTLSLIYSQWMWLRAEKKAAYLQGQADLYVSQAEYNMEIEDPTYKSVKKGTHK
jgi:hypothetical protein